MTSAGLPPTVHLTMSMMHPATLTDGLLDRGKKERKHKLGATSGLVCTRLDFCQCRLPAQLDGASVRKKRACSSDTIVVNLYVSNRIPRAQVGEIQFRH